MSQPPTNPPTGPTNPFSPDRAKGHGQQFPPYGQQPYGQQPYGEQPAYPPQQPPFQPQQPGYPPAGGAFPLPGASTTPKRSKKVPILAAAGVVAAIALGGGAFAYTKLASTGSQPDTVIPASAVGFARIDLDPSAGQKVAAVRFLDKIPAVKKAQESGGDPRESLWKAITKDDKDLSGVDYTTDIKPWLGSRAAVAMLAQANAKGEPVAMVALAVTDEGRARESLASLLSRKRANTVDVSVRSGYAIFTEKSATSIVMSEIDKGSIASNPTYQLDVKALGDIGVASAWFDVGAMKAAAWFDKLAKNSSGTSVSSTAMDQLQGRVLSAVRFDANYLEVAGVSRGGLSKAIPPPGGEIATLPADTVGAVSIAGLDELIKDNWAALSSAIGPKQIAQAESQYGIALPDDLALMLGRSLTISFPDQDWSMFSKNPKMGMKVVTTDGNRAQSLIDKTIEEQGGSGGMFNSRKDNTLFFATDQDYLDSLSQGGALGSSESFKLAVADAGSAQTAFFVDIDKIEENYLENISSSNEYKDALAAIRAVGFSIKTTGPGDGAFSLRVVAN